jgi:peptidoglycan/LPS O-acetylase OafA/YrhL
MTGTAQRERFVLLDGLRGAAALAVITDHVPSALSNVLPGRYLAVDFFFALSGFILAHVYGPRLAAGLTPGQFLRGRVIRLYPLYIAATLAGALLAAFKAVRGWPDIGLEHVAVSTLLNAVYLPVPQGLSVANWGPFPFDGPAWSLFFELAVNIVFALIALRLTTRVNAILLAFAAGALVFTAFIFGKLDGGFAYENFWAGLPRVAYAFFAGVLVYRLRETWRMPALPPWAALALLFAILAMPAGGILRPAWDAFAAIALMPLLIAFCANSRVDGIAARACAMAGALSYGFYVFQAVVIAWYDTLFASAARSGLVRTAAIAGITLLVVILARAFYEAPARRALRFLPARVVETEGASS